MLFHNICYFSADTTIGEVEHTNRIENRFQSPYRHRPVHVFGQLHKSASSPACVTVQLNVTKCHRGKYWCDVRLVTMEQFRWSGIKTERVDKEVVVCSKKMCPFCLRGSITSVCVCLPVRLLVHPSPRELVCTVIHSLVKAFHQSFVASCSLSNV